MFNQFFDKRSLYVLAALLGAHLLAALVQHSWVSILPVVAAAIVAFVLSMKRLEWGVAFAFLEIFIGGHGHLFDLSSIGVPISVRIAIFLGVMIAFTIQILRPSDGLRMTGLRWNPRRDVPWVVFGLAIVLGALVGFLQNARGNAFDDFNSYLPILYVLPIISIRWDNVNKRLMLMTLAVSAVWVASTTLLMLFGFTHLPGKFLSHLYTFVRDARLAEITILTAPDSLARLFPTGAWYFRIFQQSQIVVFAFLYALAAGFYSAEKVDRRVLAVFVLLFAGMYASLSRTFAIAAVPATFVFFALLMASKVPLKTIVVRSVLIGCAKMVTVILLWLVVVFPLPFRPDFTSSPFYKGGEGTERDLAVSSRWNLLPPMMAEIWKSPIVGSGFGKEVTFISDDPRVRAINGTGEWTTYRFEWGYQDLWLKTGVLGLVAVFLIAASYAIATQSHLRKGHDDKWVVIGLFSSTIFVLIVHVFTPYLNHPLGISLLLLPLVFLAFEDPKLKTTEALSRPMVRAPQGLSSAVATQATAE